jgi:hypothetical protein
MAAVTCPGCQERGRRIATLEGRVAELEALERDLTARLRAGATNSSLPPLANPPGAPKPLAETPTGRKPRRSAWAAGACWRGKPRRGRGSWRGCRCGGSALWGR